MRRKLTAEFLGTAWLVIGGCGTAILATAGPDGQAIADTTVGWLGVSFAFGLTVLTMAYAIGPISGCHLNPAVTIGLAAAGRHPKNEVVGYVLAQVVGAVAGAGVIYLMANGREGWVPGGFATNGFGEHSPTGAPLMACLVTEIAMTFFFLFVILRVTSPNATPAMAGLAIGLCLTLIHLISIPITNTSVNPARSTGPALVVGGAALTQLWLFWVAPIVGAVLAAAAHKAVSGADDEPLGD